MRAGWSSFDSVHNGEPPAGGRVRHGVTQMNGSDWAVYRQDDNGNRYLVKSGLSEPEANALVAELESHGHKQLYWATREPAE